MNQSLRFYISYTSKRSIVWMGQMTNVLASIDTTAFVLRLVRPFKGDLTLGALVDVSTDTRVHASVASSYNGMLIDAVNMLSQFATFLIPQGYSYEGLKAEGM